VRIDHVAGNAEEFCEPAEAFDLIVCNEVISDFTVDTLDADEAGSASALARIPHVGERLAEIGVRFENPPEQFQVNTGAMRFVQNAFRMLKPGGICVLTEFGELDRYPVFSSQLDHPEHSIHFNPIIEFASSLGFEWEFETLPDFLAMDLKFQCLSTTRPFFVALRHLLGLHGIELKKLAYTHDMLRQLVGDRMELMNVQRLTFEPIDRRCMGLSPREFKVLMHGKPVPASGRYRVELVDTPVEEEA
jgi:SAM-dependent methyltransferase